MKPNKERDRHRQIDTWWPDGSLVHDVIAPPKNAIVELRGAHIYDVTFTTGDTPAGCRNERINKIFANLEQTLDTGEN